MFIATLVAKDALPAGDISAATDIVAGSAGPIVDGVACDVTFAGSPTAARVALEALPLDVIVQRVVDRERALLVADMDSTMITVECIDELADYAGLKPQVAAITERAMRGELDFAAALDERVALLAGMAETTLDECLRERVRVMPGARALVRTLRARGGRAVLVSGGFTHFAHAVAATIGVDAAVANVLEVRGGVLTGRVLRPIVDAATKRATLIAERDALGLTAAQTLAIGDGANDIAMIEAAGLGIAYRAKPVTRAAAAASIRFGDLRVVLYALGIARRDWAAAD